MSCQDPFFFENLARGSPLPAERGWGRGVYTMGNIRLNKVSLDYLFNAAMSSVQYCKVNFLFLIFLIFLKLILDLRCFKIFLSAFPIFAKSFIFRYLTKFWVCLSFWVFGYFYSFWIGPILYYELHRTNQPLL